MRLNWYRTVNSSRNSEYIQSRRYTCGYCGEPLASEVGYAAYDVNEDNENTAVSLAKIYICHHCGGPTYFDRNGVQTPSSAFGRPVSNISKEEVKSLYDEARNCMKVSAYTAAVMCCRKSLMNVAVDQGADENKPFAYYVDYLAKQGYLPPDGKKWVGHIKDKGNEATTKYP